MAAARIDRLLHLHSPLVNIRGNSFRMRDQTEFWQALHLEIEKEEPPAD